MGNNKMGKKVSSKKYNPF